MAKIQPFCEKFTKKFISLNKQAAGRAKISPFCKSFSKIFYSSMSRREKGEKSNVFENFFYIFKKGKTKSRYTDIKNRRERCSRFKMMFYVTALKFKDGTVFAPVHSLTVPKLIEWWVTVFSLSIPQALGGFATSQSYIVFSCSPS